MSHSTRPLKPAPTPTIAELSAKIEALEAWALSQEVMINHLVEWLEWLENYTDAPTRPLIDTHTQEGKQ